MSDSIKSCYGKAQESYACRVCEVVNECANIAIAWNLKHISDLMAAHYKHELEREEKIAIWRNNKGRKQ